MVTIKCQRCDKEFDVHNYKKDTAKYCSVACKRRPESTRSCPGCNNTFEVTSKHPDKIYCSPECRSLHTLQKLIELTCEQCNSKFKVSRSREKQNPRFCSDACYREFDKPKSKTCPVCGDSFTPPGKQQKHCSKICASESMKQRVLTSCATCKKELELVKSLYNPKGNFCSRKCADIENGKRMKENPSNPRKKVQMVCSFCKNNFDIWPGRLKRKDMRQGIFCSKKCCDDHRRSIFGKGHPLDKKIECTCEWCKKTYRTKRVYKNRTRFCSRQCQGAYTAKHGIRKETTIELSIKLLLIDMNLDFTQEKPMGPFVCDFLVDAHMLVIECDGDYWHNLPNVIKRDASKNSWLKLNGYNVLRLPEYKIKNDIDWCRSQIVTACQ